MHCADNQLYQVSRYRGPSLLPLHYHGDVRSITSCVLDVLARLAGGKVWLDWELEGRRTPAFTGWLGVLLVDGAAAPDRCCRKAVAPEVVIPFIHFAYSAYSLP